MKLLILAKIDSDEKVCIYCMSQFRRELLLDLSRIYGGDWAVVDELDISKEYLIFRDGQAYNGFNPSQEHRYSNAIKEIKNL